MSTPAPPGAPRLLTTRHVAAGLTLAPLRVKYLLDSGQLPHIRFSEHGQRIVKAEALIAFTEQAGITIDWEAIINTD